MAAEAKAKRHYVAAWRSSGASGDPTGARNPAPGRQCRDLRQVLNVGRDLDVVFVSAATGEQSACTVCLRDGRSASALWVPGGEQRGRVRRPGGRGDRRVEPAQDGAGNL